MAARTASPLTPGQHQVEDDEVDRLGIEGRDRRTTVGHDGDRVPVALEIEPEELAEAGLVLDDQDPGTGDHRRNPSRAADQGNVKTGRPHDGQREVHTRS